MTVPTTARRAGPYSGNGATTTFSFLFKAFASTDLQVTKTGTTGFETVLVLNSDYSVSLNVDQTVSPGGTITYPISGTALASGEKITIVGGLAYEQTTDLLGGGSFNAQVIEDTFDRATIQIQQLEERADRALTLPVSATASTVLPVPSANKVLAWNSAANALVNINATDLASTSAYSNWRTDRFSGNDSTTAFTLAADPGSVHNMDVSIGGVTQQNGVDFTVSGTTLTFTSAPPTGTNNIMARYGQALPIATANASQVTYNPAGTGAVERSVQSKLRDVVSVKDFGAVGDGSTNDTTAVQNAINSGYTVYFPAGTYAVGAITTTGNLKIVGVGTLAMTGSLTIADAATQVIIEGLSFTKGNNIGVLQGTSGNLTTVRIQNVSVTGGYGFHFLGSAANVEVSGCSFSSLSVTSSSVQAVKIGNNDYTDSAASNYIRITNNRVVGVTNSTTAETHAFLVNGTDIAISNNTIEGVYHASTACEAIYTKGVRVAITGNTVKNCGPSEDGCIAVKGTDYGDTSAPRGYECIISGNVVSYDTNNTTQVKGITSAVQNASIVGNVLRNTFISVSGQNNLVDGNLVDIVADTYTPKAFVAEITKPDIRVSNNKFRIVSSNLNSNTISAAYVRATAGYPVERFDFSNNDCRVVWSGVTTGGSNYLAFFELWCDGATIDAQVRNNTFRVETPNITNTRSVVPYVYSGTSNLAATFMDNRIITVDPVGGGYRTFRPFGSGAATVYFQNNRSNVVPIVGANVGLVMSYDVDVTNIDATAARTLYLPSPAALGSRLRIAAANRTHNIVIDPNGTTWSDGSTSAKTLSSKGFVELQVYETGYWTVTSLSGTLT